MSQNLPQPQNFIIHPYQTEPEKGLVHLNYAFDDEIEFTETIDFGVAFDGLPKDRQEALEKAFTALSVAASVSYYKAFVPPKIDLQDIEISGGGADFFSDFYYHGLGEFAARNELDLETLKQSTQFDGDGEKSTRKLVLKNRPLVLIGGGKDSMVSVEMLREHHKDMTLFAVNPSHAIKQSIETSGLSAITVKRSLDPALFALNEQGALNGHVPITGIISFIAVAAAIIYDFDTIVLSNERSANEETLVYQGEKINHQYSKSFPAETQISEYITSNIATNLNYFSILRPLSELHIAQIFARTDRYDNAFTSCNGAHKLREDVKTRWCLNCPKCHFTFLMLATAMPKSRLLEIFGANLLEDETKLEAYEALCGLSGQKPWECVGELEEVATAFYVLSQKDDWKKTAIVETLMPKLLQKYGDLENTYLDLMTPSREHNVPREYQDILNEHLAG